MLPFWESVFSILRSEWKNFDQDATLLLGNDVALRSFFRRHPCVAQYLCLTGEAYLWAVLNMLE
jgi:hypothetical protein